MGDAAHPPSMMMVYGTVVVVLLVGKQGRTAAGPPFCPVVASLSPVAMLRAEEISAASPPPCNSGILCSVCYVSRVCGGGREQVYSRLFISRGCSIEVAGSYALSYGRYSTPPTL